MTNSTPEQLAAAIAAYRNPDRMMPNTSEASQLVRMEAALEAAAGVTPHEPGEPHDCTGLAMIGEIESLKQLLDTQRQRAGFWERRYTEAVQVDEAKLSRLIERHSCATLATEGRRIDQETICAECGWAFSVRADRTSPDQESRRKFDHVAHVAAEWLRGGGL